MPAGHVYNTTWLFLSVPFEASKLMEVQFEGETGFGSAVTQSFYATWFGLWGEGPS